ncbi:MAG: glutamyl-tRNA amidotransferase [Rhodospirillaceae bacterium]|nr:glutamyl-tRNA amidotransferase [Rhodospirillaceae bacterium]
MLRAKLVESLKQSIRAKDQRSLATIRLILAALKDRDISARGRGEPDGISESDILDMLQSMIKQRRESITMYEKGGRCELAEREQEEINIIKNFMPEQMGLDATSAAVIDVITELKASSLKDMGRVMACLKERFSGRMDFSSASSIVKDNLI